MVKPRTCVTVSLLFAAVVSLSLSGAAAAATGVVITPAEDATVDDVKQEVRDETTVDEPVSDVLRIGEQSYVYAGIVNIAAIRQLPSVSSVQLQRRASIPASPDAPTEDNFESETQYPWGIERINALPAFDSVSGTEDVDVAVVDTGVDLDHPELRSSVVWGANTTKQSNPTGVEGIGDDNNGHGTHVAGIIASTDENIGSLVGVAPTVDIYAMKALDSSGVGRNIQIAEAIILSVSGPNGTVGNSDDADIIVTSLGSRRDSPAVQQAVTYATNNGATVVSAVGNRGDGNPDTNEIEYPARYENTVAVGAVKGDSTTATFSAEGEQLDITAPGDNILSTKNGGGTKRLSGTSMAAPHVAGTLALVAADTGDISKKTALEFLEKSAVDIEQDGTDRLSGAGSLRALSAVQVSEVPSSPSISITEPTSNNTEVAGSPTIKLRASDGETELRPEDNLALGVFRNGEEVTSVNFEDSSTFEETTPGTVEIPLDTTASTFAEDAEHTIRATVTDNDGLTQTVERTVIVNNTQQGIFISDISVPKSALVSGPVTASVTVTNNAGFRQEAKALTYSPEASQYERMNFNVSAGGTQTKSIQLLFSSVGEKQLIVDARSENLQTQTTTIGLFEDGNLPPTFERTSELDITRGGASVENNIVKTGQQFNITVELTNNGNKTGLLNGRVTADNPTEFDAPINNLAVGGGETVRITKTHSISTPGSYEISLGSEQVANDTTTVTVAQDLVPTSYEFDLTLPANETILNDVEYTVEATVTNVGTETQNTTIALNDSTSTRQAKTIDERLSTGEEAQITLNSTPSVDADGTVGDVTAEAYLQENYSGDATPESNITNKTTEQIEVSAVEMATTELTGRDSWNNTTLYDLTTTVANNGGKNGTFGGQLLVNGTLEKSIAPREIPQQETRQILTTINISKTNSPNGGDKNLTVIQNGANNQIEKTVDFSGSVPNDAQQINLRSVTTLTPEIGENITRYRLQSRLGQNNTTTVTIETNTSVSDTQTVKIPATKNPASSTVGAVEPELGIPEGGQFRYTIKSADFVNTTRVVTVTDPRTPDVRLNNSTAATRTVEGDELFQVDVGVDNQGPVEGTAEGNISLEKTESGNTETVTQVAIDQPLAPNSKNNITKEIDTDIPGEYDIVVTLLVHQGTPGKIETVETAGTGVVTESFDRIPPGVNATGIPQDLDDDSQSLFEDITGDGAVTSADMVSLIAVNETALEPFEKQRLDFAGDGREFNGTAEAVAFRDQFDIDKRVPRDPDGDGDYENIDDVEGTSSGEGRWLFDRLEEDNTNTWLNVYPELIDFNNDGTVDIDDVRALHIQVQF